jgi:hypothetical protein
MKIVIDIPEDVLKRTVFYREFRDLNDCVTTIKALENGTPLPKGYGNLIQRESAEAIFKNARKALYEQSRKEQIKDFQTREMMLLNAEQFVHLIEPIIEADKG